MRKHGLSIDNLIGVDLVTADGERLRVDADSEPDLFWGLRGGGGNFGIATALEYQVHPVGPMVLGGPIFWKLEDARQVVRFVRDFAPTAPDELGITIAAMKAPPSPVVPTESIGTPVLGLILVWAGDPELGRSTIAQFQAIGSPIGQLIRPTPYVILQSMLDAGAPHGRHYYWKSHRLPFLPDAAIDVIVEQVQTVTSPFSQIGGWAIGGAVSRVDPHSTAIGSREPGFDINIAAAWQPADTDPEHHVDWVRATWERLQPFRDGVYANFLSDDGMQGVRYAYGDRLQRLTALKDRYDPTNVFRMNANITPSV
jgi:FAD/FMN-containing dehydrogenase